MNHFRLPIQLTEDLTLRWGTSDDVENLGKFNRVIHEEPDGNGDIEAWVLDLLNGKHPTTTPEMFTIIENKAGEIISSCCLIPQTWNYDGISFPVGRPELIGTLDAYRGRGLVRKQMQVIHDLSLKQGNLMEAITGIPWFYRQFGYEMGLDLGGGMRHPLPHKLPTLEEESLSWRKATREDIPTLERLYRQHCKASAISTEKSTEFWEYSLFHRKDPSVYNRDCRVVETKDGHIVAYVLFKAWASFSVVELGHDPRASLREIGLFLAKAFRVLADSENLDPNRKNPITKIYYSFGPYHPIYEALKPELEPDLRHYAWYVRIADYKAFIDHIRPVLEQRLARSVMAGHSGTFKLNFYTQTLTLTFDTGKLTQIGSYTSEKVGDGHVNLPDHTFIALICGRHTLEELRQTRPDAYGNAEGQVLINILFPKQPSNPLGLE